MKTAGMEVVVMGVALMEAMVDTEEADKLTITTEILEGLIGTKNLKTRDQLRRNYSITLERIQDSRVEEGLFLPQKTVLRLQVTTVVQDSIQADQL